MFYTLNLRAQITWQERPSDYQLFPRNSLHRAVVTFRGILTDSLFQDLHLVCVMSNGMTDTQIIQRNGAALPFSFQFEDTLIATLTNYSYRLYGIHANGWQLLQETQHICCGDVYLVAGQSNALAHLPPDTVNDPALNPFIRTLGRPSASVPQDFSSDTTWGLARPSSAVTNFHHLVGHLAFRLGDSLVRRWGIPVCILNVAQGSSTIAQQQAVNGAQDLQRIYDRMLYRCRLANVQDAVKAIIWYQGESDASTLTNTYTQQFRQLLSSWMNDFQGLQQVYVFQINHGCGNMNSSSLREEMRQLPTLNPGLIRVLSTMNILHDGCHFTAEGYQRLAHELIPFFASDFFQEPMQQNDYPPDVLKAIYTGPRQIALLFNQAVQFDSVKGMHRLCDYFYNEWDMSAWVRSIDLHADTLLLNLYLSFPVSKISYTPPCTYQGSMQVYQGPYIYNNKGWGALTFDQVPVEQLDQHSGEDQILVFPNPGRASQPVRIVSATPFLVHDLIGHPMGSTLDLPPGSYIIKNSSGAGVKYLVQQH